MRRQLQLAGVVAVLLCAAVLPTAATPGPDPEAVALIETLGLREAATPVRDWSGWRKPEKITIYLPEHLRRVRSDYREWLQRAAVALGAELLCRNRSL